LTLNAIGWLLHLSFHLCHSNLHLLAVSSTLSLEKTHKWIFNCCLIETVFFLSNIVVFILFVLLAFLCFVSKIISLVNFFNKNFYFSFKFQLNGF
jgi:hypothetical protein